MRHVTMKEHCRGHAGGVVFGLLMVVAGVFLLLNHMGIFHVEDITQLWPSLLVALGIVKLFQRPTTGPRVVFSLLLAGVGAMLQMRSLGVVDFNVHVIWPLITIAVGFIIVWMSIHHKRYHRISISEDQINKLVIFGGEESRMTTQQFEGGDVTAIFGGIVIDMRGVEMKGAEAQLNTSVIFGGVELRVPKHWEVVVHGTPVLGGFDNKTSVSRDDETKAVRKLIVQGNVVFGGVELKN